MTFLGLLMSVHTLHTSLVLPFRIPIYCGLSSRCPAKHLGTTSADRLCIPLGMIFRMRDDMQDYTSADVLPSTLGDDRVKAKSPCQFCSVTSGLQMRRRDFGFASLVCRKFFLVICPTC
ncbi:hypothetical protein FGO68_gene6854 [Halteria grandinella]|uniref:Secreted protein n=1 Tax=Halteria grandinella TaxID=5974 RepID=A0A8J8NB42_HALGN|nr:hypothetical protein FGO68_gene6854 [Halteria grandinella]